MITLRLFGSVDLADDGGRQFDALLRQPKRMAVLAYLAAATPRGFHRRDKLLAQFWPERSDDRARHALSQTLHVLRRELGEEAILTRGEGEIALNGDVVGSDVAAFEEAVEHGELPAAVELYRGDFLAGLFVSEAPEFERWVEGERDRLARCHRTVLEQLAERAARAGDRLGAASWWRRVSEQDPYSTRVTLRVMEALEVAGDRAGALHHAEGHAARLKEDMEAEPAPDVVALAGRLRAEPVRHDPAAERLERLRGALAGRYAIQREVGHGSMATVYLADDVKHHRKVALKVMRPELAATLGTERFLREIRVAAKLNHPHILGLHDSGRDDGFLYYVMPYVQGESLRNKLTRETQLSIEEALQITHDVAGAIDYAHHQGVIHRDIKPENILLHEGEAMVADFGIALAVEAAAGERLTETGLSPGTPEYMSPEQGTGDCRLDGRSDVYSLGAVLYEMLAGEPPFSGATSQAVIAKMLKERPTHLRVVRDTVPEHVDEAVMKALAKVPVDRFATPGDLLKALYGDAPAPGRFARVAESSDGQRRPRGGWKAMRAPVTIVAMIVAVVVGVWRVMPNETTLSERLWVEPFRNLTGADSLDLLGQVASLRISDLVVRAGVMPVMSTGRGQADVSGLPEETLVITGDYRPDADGLVFDARVSTRSGESLYAVTDVRGRIDDPMVALDSLAGLLLGWLVLKTEFRADLSYLRSNAPSYGAVQEYSLGRRAINRQAWRDAEQHFRAAIAADPTYTPPYLSLALVALYNQGRWAAMDSVVAEMRSAPVRWSEFDRLGIDVIAARLRGDYVAEGRAAERLARLAPGSNWLGVGYAYMSAGLPEIAATAFRHDREEGMSGNFPSIWEKEAAQYHLLGEYENERHLLEEAETRLLLPFPQRARVLLVEGESWSTISAEIDLSPSHAFYLSQEAVAHGVPDVADSAASFAFRGADTLWRAMAAILLGRYEVAMVLLDTLHTRFPASLQAAGHLGLAAALMGDTVTADAMLDKLTAGAWGTYHGDDVLPLEDRQYLFGAPTYWQAVIHNALGRLDTALALLKDGFDAGLAHHPWSHHGYDHLQWLHADTHFQSLWTDPRYKALLPEGS